MPLSRGMQNCGPRLDELTQPPIEEHEDCDTRVMAGVTHQDLMLRCDLYAYANCPRIAARFAPVAEGTFPGR